MEHDPVGTTANARLTQGANVPQRDPERIDSGPPSQPAAPKTTKTPALVAAAFALLLVSLCILRSVNHPRTDDAEILANFIGVAPEVSGPIVALHVKDNQYVRAGQLLYVIDDRPYRYALQKALSEQAALEGQIVNKLRQIRSQESGVHVATASIYSNASNRDAMAATVSESQATVRDDEAAVRRAQADLRYAEDNLHRLEPLLAQQYVTVDQVDKARTLVETRTRAVQQQQAQLALAEAHVNGSLSHLDQSAADVEQSKAKRDQAANGVETLEPLTSQREDRSSAVRQAQYNLDHCRAYAPFDGYITNLTTSVGEYAHTGTQIFTMIDSTSWWAVANYRETQLSHVSPGSAADVFLMSAQGVPLSGTVESIGYGVTPDPSVSGALAPGLPAVQRNLSWVHLASRYPVRIRINAPPPGVLRIGQSAVTVIHPTTDGRRNP